MQTTFKIMRKEMNYWHNKVSFYLFYAISLFCIGIYTWFFNQTFPTINIDRLVPSNLQAIYWGIAIIVPILATRGILEERRMGTLSVLLSKPVSIYQFIAGKLGAVCLILLSFFVFSLAYYFSIASLTKFTTLYIVLVASFLYLMGVTYAVISMLIASFFNAYWKCYLWTYSCIFMLHFFFTFLGKSSVGEVQTFLYYLGMQKHLSYFLDGGFALSGIVYLLSLICIGLVATFYKLSRDNS